MIKIRAAEQRGKADFGWLKSQHSFSFGSYYDPNEMGHGELLVINDDYVEPSKGFATHPHKNMEILSYVLEGTIAHKDSQGNEYQVPAGDFQLMSAGRGITHSEFNPSNEEPLKFLQIWVKPNVVNTEPGYQQKAFTEDSLAQLIFSPDGAEGSLQIKQDAWLRRVRLDEGQSTEFVLGRTQHTYLHVVSGNALLNEELAVKTGDGVRLSQENLLSLQATEEFEALLFEV